MWANVWFGWIWGRTTVTEHIQRSVALRACMVPLPPPQLNKIYWNIVDG